LDFFAKMSDTSLDAGPSFHGGNRDVGHSGRAKTARRTFLRRAEQSAFHAGQRRTGGEPNPSDIKRPDCHETPFRIPPIRSMIIRRDSEGGLA